jgi:excisionase family DNA binding protein
MFTIQQTAARLGVAEISVRRAIARGDLPAVRVGIRALRVAPGALDDYLRRRVVDRREREQRQG